MDYVLDEEVANSPENAKSDSIAAYEKYVQDDLINEL